MGYINKGVVNALWPAEKIYKEKLQGERTELLDKKHDWNNLEAFSLGKE